MMHTYCDFLAISCLLGYNLQGNQILMKIGSEFMELSSNPIFVKIQFSVRWMKSYNIESCICTRVLFILRHISWFTSMPSQPKHSVIS